MKIGNKRVRDKILFFILPIIVIALLIIILLSYYFTKQIFTKAYTDQKEQVEAHVINAVNLIDAGFRMLEKSIEKDMEKEILEFKNAFEAAGGDPNNISLQELKTTMGEEFDLMIVDSKTTIIKSTMPEGLNFNFMEFDEELGKEINRIRLANEIRHERIRTNVGTGFLSKFTYIPSNDHKYLLEIAYSEGGLSSAVSDLEPIKITTELKKITPMISDIRIFDVYGYEFVNSGDNYEPTEESLKIVERAKKELKYEITDGNEIKSYFYIDLKGKKQTMTDNSKIVEIIFDNTVILSALNRITYITFTVGFVVVGVLIIFIFLLSKKITEPITQLSIAANKVSKGDYNVAAEKTTDDEIGELSKVFNGMINKIKENFAKIENQKNELEDYNKNLEKKVEERTAELYEERELFKTTLFSMGDGVISTDKCGRVEIINKVAEGLTGWTKEEAYGKPLNEVFHIINEITREACKCPVGLVYNSGGAVELDDHTILISKDGIEIPIEDSAAPIKDENGNFNGIVLIFRDYSEKKEKQEKIQYLSFRDQLTGLYNRRFLEEELLRLDCDRNYPLTLVMLDVNGLKLINDAFGHQMGDLVLQKIADNIKKVCRVDDIIARIGGDEFVILLPKTNAIDVEIMLKRLNNLTSIEGIDAINLSISYGWATKKEPTESMSDIFKLAEDHMYRRKLSESRNMHYKTIEIIQDTLNEKSEREKAHSENVSKLCGLIGSALNLSSEDISELKTAGYMHDIGKIAIDLGILDKPSHLSESERVEIERHPELGYQILRSLNEYSKIAEYVLAHHERWDGNGFPRNLKGDDIPLNTRIIAIADTYDALTSDRPYRKALSKEEAIEVLKTCAGSQLDPMLVDVFIEKVLDSI